MRAVGHPNVKFRVEALAGHRVVSRATRVIERQHDLRNSGARHGLHHFGAGANDSSAFSFRATMNPETS